MSDDAEGFRAPGWYDDGAGLQRWWTGRDWTNHTQATSSVSRQGKTPIVNEVSVARQQPAHPQASEPGTLWSAVGRSITGLGSGRFRLTADMLYFEYGTFSTNAQQIQTWQIHDVDASQSMTQKARGVGTISLRARRMNGDELVTLSDVPDFREGVRLINEAAYAAGVRKRQAEQTQIVNYSGFPPAATTPPTSSPGAASDLMTELVKLAALRDQGVLSEEEFVAAKRLLLKL